MKIRRLLLFLLLLSCIFAVSGCHSTPSRRSYREESFRAEISGELFGIPFGAQLSKDAEGEHLVYLHPDALSQLTLHRSADGITLESGELSTALPEEALAGLLSPLDALFSEREILRVQKTGEGSRLTLPGGSILTLTPEGFPADYTSPSLRFSVVWWETP